jgi:hypothetical protein
MPVSDPVAVKRGKDNEVEDMESDLQYGKKRRARVWL